MDRVKSVSYKQLTYLFKLFLEVLICSFVWFVFILLGLNLSYLYKKYYIYLFIPLGLNLSYFIRPFLDKILLEGSL